MNRYTKVVVKGVLAVTVVVVVVTMDARGCRARLIRPSSSETIPARMLPTKKTAKRIAKQ